MKPSVLFAVLVAFAASAIIAYTLFRPGTCGGGIPEDLPIDPPTADTGTP